MNNKEILASITEFSKSRNIDRPTLIGILEDMFSSLIHKRYGIDTNFEIDINPNKGELKIWHYRTVVADNVPEVHHINSISLQEARKIEPDFEKGEEVAQEITLDQFDRRDILQGLQIFLQKEQRVEQNQIYEKYKKLVGKLVNVEVYNITPYQAILHDSDKNELFLPKSKQIPGELLKRGNSIKALVEEVNPTNFSVKIILSRTSPFFLEQLFTQEIPEITDGIVQIKKIARIPGVRAKIAVMSQYDHIDPVGACVGIGGNRVYNLSKHELNNEQINVVQYTDKTSILLKRVIEPAEITSMKEDDEQITITMQPDQVPLAIGKKGQNIFLVTQILGKPVQIEREITQQEQNIYLTEFSDKIDEKLIQALKEVGIDTVRGLLYAHQGDIIRRTGIPKEDLEKTKSIINQEFKIRSSPTPSHATQSTS